MINRDHYPGTLPRWTEMRLMIALVRVRSSGYLFIWITLYQKKAHRLSPFVIHFSPIGREPPSFPWYEASPLCFLILGRRRFEDVKMHQNRGGFQQKGESRLAVRILTFSQHEKAGPSLKASSQTGWNRKPIFHQMLNLNEREN
jgi:hypothetical protein